MTVTISGFISTQTHRLISGNGHSFTRAFIAKASAFNSVPLFLGFRACITCNEIIQNNNNNNM